jgi:protein phosphatase-4 regulatory subunit 3
MQEDGSPQSTRRRVKLYLLNEAGQWDDKGTGHITCQYDQNTQGFGLFLRSESDNEMLLEHRIAMDPIYQHQNETIITWTDPESEADYALSFQENEGCNDMWDQILSVQGRLNGGGAEGSHVLGRGLADGGEMMVMGGARAGEAAGGVFPEIELPSVTPGNLEKIAEIVNDCASGLPPWREQLAQHLSSGLEEAEGGAPDGQAAASTTAAAVIAGRQDDNEGGTTADADAATAQQPPPGRRFIADLITLYQQCEVSENEEQLMLLYHIVKGMFFLNEPRLVAMLLGEDVAMDVMGILENEPDLSEAQRTKHREMLRHGNELFKEVISIRSSAVKGKIRQTVLLMYLKDVVLARTIEDSTLHILNQMEFMNKMQIVSTLQADDAYINEMFAKLAVGGTDDRSDFLEILKLLQELCTMAKNQQPQQRDSFYGKMIEKGLFDVIEQRMICDQDMSVRANGVDMLDMIVKHNPSLLRRHLLSVSQRPQLPFYNTIVKTMVYDPVEGVQGQLKELIATLIDVETFNETDEKDAFLDEFYSIFINLIDAAWPNPNQQPGAPNTLQSPVGAGHFTRPVSAVAKTFIVELLTYCVAHHEYVVSTSQLT